MTEGAKKNLQNPSPNSSKDADPFVGRVFNERFKVIELIARGGLGAVYKSEQAPLGRICALKILRPRYQETTPDEFNKRFFLEASIASKLTHPNNVTIYDYGHTDDDVYFMAMEYLEGATLARAIRVEGLFNEERASHVARQICRALREAHSLGVIHRDIKPGNIFISQKHDETDFVKVLDFGLVKEVNVTEKDLTQAGMFLGSPKYMAPEQIQGLDVDVRTDIYAVGVVMFEMVTGKPPFECQSSVQTLIAHLNDEIPSLRDACPDCDVSPAFEALVRRCLSKDPSQRPASVDDVLNALKLSPGALRTGTISGLSGAYAIMASSGSSAIQNQSTLSGPHVFMAGQSTSDGVSAHSDGGVDPTRPRTSKVVWGSVAAVVVAAALAGAFVLATRIAPERAASAEAAPAATPSSEPAPSATAPQRDPAPPASIATAPQPPPTPVRIVTTPPGASVHLGDENGKELCASTPCDVDRRDFPDDGGATLLIAKFGFVRVRTELDAAQTQVNVNLVPVPKGNRPAFGGEKPAPPPAPTSYKIDPYG